MANRQVATVDDSWYGGCHTSDDDTSTKMDNAKKRPGDPRNPPWGEPEVQKTKRFSLPMEPTESLDRNREYPPIVTVDGRVDTDIDHLMENADDDDLPDSPIQDIPSRFPKPHVVRVIDGSLDDDIDNLVNHDGTMAHTLVDAPKNFTRGDLKEINSSTAPHTTSPSHKKQNSIAAGSPRQATERIFGGKMNREEEDSGTQSPSLGSKVVPYFERNNSSKAPTIPNDDADFCHLKQSLEEGFVSLPPDLDKVGVTYASNESNEFLPVYNHVDTDGDDEKSQCGQELAEGSNFSHKEDNADRSTKSEDMSRAENASDMDKEEGTEAGDISRAPSIDNENLDLQSDSISQVVEQFLKTMSKEELEKRLRVGSSNASSPPGEENELIESTTMESNGGKEENIIVKSEEDHPSTLQTEQTPNETGISSQLSTQESQDTSLFKNSASCQKTTSTDFHNEIQINDTISMLKKSLEIIAKDSNISSEAAESHKLLTVTALKVAGESMTAAAKMADALTLLVQSSQQANNKSIAEPTKPLTQIPKSVDKKEDIRPANTVSEPGICRNVKPNTTRNLPLKLKEIPLPPPKKPVDKPPVGTENEHHPEACKVNPSISNHDQEAVCEGKPKTSKENHGSDFSVVTESKHSKKHHDNGERVEKDEKENKDTIKREHKKNHSERKRREGKHSEAKDEHRRKRSSRKVEEVMYIDDDMSLDEEHYAGSPKSYVYLDELDKRLWEYTQQNQRMKENAEVGHYDPSPNSRSHYNDHDSDRRREKRRNHREDHHRKSRHTTTSPHKRTKSSSSPYKREHSKILDVNESHSPDMSSNDPSVRTSVMKTSRSSRESFGDDVISRRSGGGPPSRLSPMGGERAFVKSEPWTLPEGERYAKQGDSYFDQVARHLKPFSPTRGGRVVSDPQREYLRAKLVGSPVDPMARDSDFDSIEYNANARPSESTRVHFDDDVEELWRYRQGENQGC